MQTSEGLSPLGNIQRLPRPEIDANCAEFRGAPRLWRVRIHVDPRRYFKTDKAGSDDRRLKLCFQQSTGDSALP